jgi:hypothetical protein
MGSTHLFAQEPHTAATELTVVTRCEAGIVLGYCKASVSLEAGNFTVHIRSWWLPKGAEPRFRHYENVGSAALATLRAALPCQEYHATVRVVDSRARKSFPLSLQLLSATLETCARGNP